MATNASGHELSKWGATTTVTAGLAEAMVNVTSSIAAMTNAGYYGAAATFMAFCYGALAKREVSPAALRAKMMAVGVLGSAALIGLNHFNAGAAITIGVDGLEFGEIDFTPVTPTELAVDLGAAAFGAAIPAATMVRDPRAQAAVAEHQALTPLRDLH